MNDRVSPLSVGALHLAVLIHVLMCFSGIVASATRYGIVPPWAGSGPSASAGGNSKPAPSFAAVRNFGLQSQYPEF